MPILARSCYAYLLQGLDELYKNCTKKNMQGSGPGGQHRNRVKTGVELHHRPSGLKVRCTRFREAERNRKHAIQLLRIHIGLLMGTPLEEADLADGLSILGDWQKYLPERPTFRIKINPRHQDYAFLLGLVLLALEIERGVLRETAQRFACSSSAIIRFLKLDKQVLQATQKIRARHGLATLQ